MPDEARLILAFALALAGAFVATPVAIALAHRTGFHDHPVGYKGHRRPTPYLGGAAVVAAFLLAGTLVGGELARLSPIVVCAFALWCLGTADDKLNLTPQLRLGVEFGLATTLWATDLGWSVGSAPVDLLLTNLWVVGLVNAFNLMDNMDGAAASVGAVTTLAAAAFAVIQGDLELAILCVGMAGACLGFLPYNLAGPARIFLGDGGSLPIGFVAAATIMAVPSGGEAGWTLPLAATILAGLPLVDTALVMISRHRARVPLLVGGRDHMTHRLATRLASPRQVAVVLAVVQAVLGAVAIGVVQLGEGSTLSAWVTWFVAATAAVVLLETRTWAPARTPPEADPAPREPVEQVEPAAPPDRGEGDERGAPRSPTPVEAGAILFVTVACGLSPALYGFYRVSVWGPIALFMLAALLGMVIARPAAPRRVAVVALAALAGLWLWALASTGWAESADQALTEANRWLLYAAVFGVLVLLLRDDRLSVLLIGSAGLVVVLFGGYLTVRLLSSSGPELFLNSRLHEPLGYINGQAAYLLLGLWPLVALAERARSHALAGGAIAAAVMLCGLAVLGQTRAVVPAAIVSAIVLVAVLPGRAARLWALLAIAVGVGLAAAPLIDVYDGGSAARPDAGTVRTAMLALLGAAAFFGAAFALGRWAAAGRAGPRLRKASTPALTGLLAIAAVAGLVAIGNPFDRAREEWDAFRSPGAASQQEDRSRFTSGAGNRYDYWRVAWRQIEDEPLRGLGAGNYDRTYFLERRTTEDVRQPHSIALQALAELGLVGGLLLLAFVGTVLAGFARRARAARTSERDLGLAVAAGGTFLVWLVHTGVDWLHLIPGLTGIALCGAAVLVGPWRRPHGSATRPRARIAIVAGCAAVALVGAFLVGGATLADDLRSGAQDRLEQGDPVGALEKSADSLDLNDEALGTLYVRAAAFARLNDYRRARATLLEATRREPHDFVPWGLLGDLASRRGDPEQAARDYRRASRLNPRDGGLRRLARDPLSAPL